MDILIKNRHGRVLPVPQQLAQKIQGQVEIKGKILGREKNGQYKTESVQLESAPRQDRTIVDLSGREASREQWERSQRARTRR